jgi:hypothetical protein
MTIAEEWCERALLRSRVCSISLPLRGTDRRSTVGLMAPLPHGEDDRLLAAAGRTAEYLGGQ